MLQAGREVRNLGLWACTVELCLQVSWSASVVRFNANQLRFAAWLSFEAWLSFDVAFAWCRDIFEAVQTIRFARVSLKDPTEVCMFCFVFATLLSFLFGGLYFVLGLHLLESACRGLLERHVLDKLLLSSKALLFLESFVCAVALFGWRNGAVSWGCVACHYCISVLSLLHLFNSSYFLHFWCCVVCGVAVGLFFLKLLA